MQFDDLRLKQPLLRAIHASGYDTPTPIQAKAIPHVLKGRDLLGCAQTGTGKTAAFALPMLHLLMPEQDSQQRDADVKAALTTGRRRRRPRPAAGRTIRGLVLAPTRELAQQIHESFATYGRHSGLRSVPIFGGVNQNRQVRDLQQGTDVVIATPGRLLDLIGQGLLSLQDVSILVLDEADRMLDMGFLPDIRRILAQVPQQRQSLLFSATMPGPIRELADDMLDDPVSLKMARVSAPAAGVQQWVYHVEKPDKPELLAYLLKGPHDGRTLIFSRTKHGADRLVRILGKVGVDAVALHGNKSQGARTRALAAFRTGDSPVMVATDIAARGLDVDDIALVINYDMTPDPETYIHRIGRTARAGATGVSITFCMSDQRGDLKAIEKLLQGRIEVAKLPPLKTKPRPTSGKPDPKQARPRAGKAAASGKTGRRKQAGNAPAARKKAQHPLKSKRRRPRAASA